MADKSVKKIPKLSFTNDNYRIYGLKHPCIIEYIICILLFSPCCYLIFTKEYVIFFIVMSFLIAYIYNLMTMRNNEKNYIQLSHNGISLYKEDKKELHEYLWKEIKKIEIKKDRSFRSSWIVMNIISNKKEEYPRKIILNDYKIKFNEFYDKLLEYNSNLEFEKDNRSFLSICLT